MKNKILYVFAAVVLCGFQLKAQELTLYLIGDSTMSDKKNPESNPEFGWGQVLPMYFTDAVNIDNRAVNGRSTRSFIAEGRWNAVKNELKSGDYVFIQFGHNDQKINDPKRYTNPYTAYRKNLEIFVNETRAAGANPVLFSSIVRRKFNEQGTLIDTHGVYPMVARQVAEDLNVPFIDLQYLTELMEESYGVEKSKDLHLHFQPGENDYFPDGKEDDTHLSELGAKTVSGLVVKELIRLNISIKNFLKQE